ncbi:MAG: twin-arginine translocase subunit TatC [Collinsella sp.]
MVVSVFAAAIVLYFAHARGARHLEDPIRSFVPDGKFYITHHARRLWLAFLAGHQDGRVMCTPMIIWQILAFFLPALRPNERKWVVPTVLASTVLFFLGAIFCYFIIIPAGFEWLIGETSAVATALPDLENYVNMELLFMIGFGVAFELPLIIFYLSVFHIVSYAAFRSAWRYVYVGLLAGSAVITPDGSPVTLGLMYGALLSLYEISLAIARVVITAREGKEGLFVSRLDLFSDDEEDSEE